MTGVFVHFEKSINLGHIDVLVLVLLLARTLMRRKNSKNRSKE